MTIWLIGALIMMGALFEDPDYQRRGFWQKTGLQLLVLALWPIVLGDMLYHLYRQIRPALKRIEK